MAASKQLNKQDILFVAGETENVYHHTAGLAILDISDSPGFNFEYLKAQIIERIKDVPQFRWRLHEVPMALDLPYWVEDENFSYDHHFKRIAVPSPGDRQAVSEVVAHLYSRHLNRKRPLWEIWYIEGLEGGRSAILQKLHHCMMDGQGASQLAELMCDFEPDAKARPLDPHITNAKAGNVPQWWRQSAATALHLANFSGAASRGIFDLLTPFGRREKKQPVPDTPMTRFNEEISADRGFIYSSLPLEDVKTVKRAFDVTVNDVIMALVSSSLRSYLSARDELPELSLRTGMAVSLRTEDDDEFSNKVTQTTITLATDQDDSVARLKAISADARQVKERARSGGTGMMEMLQSMPPLLVHAMVNMTTVEQAVQMLGSNVMVSNVRGSDRYMYTAGARIEAMYPMSILTHGMAVNFTCITYTDQVDFGVAIEPDLVPDPWDIVDGLEVALRDYLKLAKKKAPRKKATRKKAAVKKSPRKKAAAKKAAINKATAKKSTRKKPAKKKTAAKKAPRKKAVAKKSAAKRR